MVFIVFMLFRVGGNGGNMVTWGDNTDSFIFGIMTSAGYFFFVIILIIGIVMGDNNHKITVMRTLMFKQIFEENLFSVAVVQPRWIPFLHSTWNWATQSLD